MTAFTDERSTRVACERPHCYNTYDSSGLGPIGSERARDRIRTMGWLVTNDLRDFCPDHKSPPLSSRLDELEARVDALEAHNEWVADYEREQRDRA